MSYHAQIIDSLCSLADLQELEEGRLKLEGGSALLWRIWWQPWRREEEGIPRIGVCNVYNTEFPSSLDQSLSTYNGHPSPLSSRLVPSPHVRAYPALVPRSLESIKLCLTNIKA